MVGWNILVNLPGNCNNWVKSAQSCTPPLFCTKGSGAHEWQYFRRNKMSKLKSFPNRGIPLQRSGNFLVILKNKNCSCYKMLRHGFFFIYLFIYSSVYLSKEIKTVRATKCRSWSLELFMIYLFTRLFIYLYSVCLLFYAILKIISLLRRRPTMKVMYYWHTVLLSYLHV